MNRPRIFDFLDYRQYFGEMLEYLRLHQKKFSFREFSKQAGFGSPSYPQSIVQGKRNLSSDSIEKVSKALSLSIGEREFFNLLVHFSQVKDGALKESWHLRIQRFLARRKMKSLSSDHFEYLSTWYHVAIRELVAHPNFQEDPAWIASVLQPSISTSDAQKSLNLLQSLKLIVRDPSGKLTVAEPRLTTSLEVGISAAMNFHRKALEISKVSLEKVPPHERDYRAMVFRLNDSQMPQFKKEVQKFLQNLLEKFSPEGDSAQKIMQLNIQLYPLMISEPKEPRR